MPFHHKYIILVAVITAVDSSIPINILWQLSVKGIFPIPGIHYSDNHQCTQYYRHKSNSKRQNFTIITQKIIFNQLKYIFGTRDTKPENTRVSIQVINSILSYHQLNITDDYQQYSIWHISRVKLFSNHQSTQLHHISTMSSGYILVKINLFFDIS